MKIHEWIQSVKAIFHFCYAELSLEIEFNIFGVVNKFFVCHQKKEPSALNSIG